MLSLPTHIFPYDKAVVTAPPAFSWTPGGDNDAIYLNVSTNPGLNPVDVVNWKDDGSHCYCPEDKDVAKFQALKGKIVYWQLIADKKNGQRIKTPVRSCTIGDLSIDPYYNFIHLGWPGGILNWNPDDLSSIRASDLNVIKSVIGSGGKTVNRKLGFSFLVPYFYINDMEHNKDLVRRLCKAAEETNMPVLIGLDGYVWWGGRPDLWNWWDPNSPGYNPNNKNNVEWTSWSPNDAVKADSWRNWGNAFKMNEPHPNLTSPTFINANQTALMALISVIKVWYDGLAEDKKFLFGGIRVGSEVGIGLNYYYPIDPNVSNDSPYTSRQIGYAAVKTAGIRSSGNLTQSDVTRAVQFYMGELCKTVYEAGIPRRKIFAHCGAEQPNSSIALKFATADAALNPYAHPGWSFYTQDQGPNGLAGLDDSLNKIASNFWGGPEWGGPGSDAIWEQVFKKFEAYRNSKFVNYFSFINPAQAAALKSIIDHMPLWLHTPVLHTAVWEKTATLTWSIPSQTSEAYLNVTTLPPLKIDGSFATIDVANEQVTNINKWVLNNLKPGIYYWKLFADGQGRRVASDMAVFEIKGP